MESDAEIVRRVRIGKVDAYEVLVRKWAPRILALCRARVRHAQAAEDLAQETLLRGYRALSTLETPEKFGSWLLGIAVRTCLDWLKAKERTQVPLPGEAEAFNVDGGDPLSQVARQEGDRKIWNEIDNLPDGQREVLLLFYYDELSYREIAGMLGIAEATVNVRLTKARSRLRDRLSRLRS